MSLLRSLPFGFCGWQSLSKFARSTHWSLFWTWSSRVCASSQLSQLSQLDRPEKAVVANSFCWQLCLRHTLLKRAQSISSSIRRRTASQSAGSFLLRFLWISRKVVGLLAVLQLQKGRHSKLRIWRIVMSKTHSPPSCTLTDNLVLAQNNITSTAGA